MEFEWDDNKRQINIEKHGIDFADAEKVFQGFTYKIGSRITDYGEQRIIETGLLNNLEVTVVYTMREDRLRIISMRRARHEERDVFYEEAEKIGNRLCETESNEG